MVSLPSSRLSSLDGSYKVRRFLMVPYIARDFKVLFDVLWHS